jgi:hypothetical protein
LKNPVERPQRVVKRRSSQGLSSKWMSKNERTINSGCVDALFQPKILAAAVFAHLIT